MFELAVAKSAGAGISLRGGYRCETSYPRTNQGPINTDPRTPAQNNFE